jgi:hypothetical protein
VATKEIITPAKLDEKLRRNWHSCVEYENSLYIFGGKSDEEFNNDLWRFTLFPSYTSSTSSSDSSKQLQLEEIASQRHREEWWGYWEEIGIFARKKASAKPPARYAHSAVVLHGSMLVFAGYDADNTARNDLWCFHLKNCAWTCLTENRAESSPPPRFHHSAVVLGRSMFVFGGKGKEAALNDLWQWTISELGEGEGYFDCLVGTWTKCKTKVMKKKKRSKKKGKRSSIPEARWGHVAVMDEENRAMIIYGGTDGTQIFTDIWAFYLDTNVWCELYSSGEGLNAACFHAACITYHGDTSHILMFGGKDMQGHAQNDMVLVKVLTVEKRHDPWGALIPSELLVEIFSYLDAISLGKCLLVCRLWNCIASANELWKNLQRTHPLLLYMTQHASNQQEGLVLCLGKLDTFNTC